MSINDIKLGRRVKSNTILCSIWIGREGTIVEDYGTGITIQWDPEDEWEKKRPLTDGYSYEGHDELVMLDLI